MKVKDLIQLLKKCDSLVINLTLISNCCGANPYLDMIETGVCSQCLEHCEFENEMY